MSNIIPFPGASDFDSGDDDAYDGPVPPINSDATLYTLTEVAYLLDLSRAVTAEYLGNGTIPGVGLGDDWLIHRHELEAWLDGLPREGWGR
ncbi:helix-turn-helix domain-containing protein [Actinosynnema sp. CA-248983]